MLTQMARFSLTYTLAAHRREIKFLYYSPKYKYIFSSSYDNQILVWNPYVKKPLIYLKSTRG